MLKLEKGFTINGGKVHYVSSFCGIDLYLEGSFCEETTIYLVKGDEVVQMIEVESDYAQAMSYISEAKCRK